jgi:hypothetical protein
MKSFSIQFSPIENIKTICVSFINSWSRINLKEEIFKINFDSIWCDIWIQICVGVIWKDKNIQLKSDDMKRFCDEIIK